MTATEYTKIAQAIRDALLRGENYLDAFYSGRAEAVAQGRVVDANACAAAVFAQVLSCSE